MGEDMQKTKGRRTKLKIFIAIITIIIILLLYAGIAVVGIYEYLKEYGYGVDELPKTLAVYCHLSKGFTVEKEESGDSIFIGREDLLFYTYFVEKHGYKCEQYGSTLSFIESNSKNQEWDFSITATEDWCHWFRVYIIDNDYKIEDFD